MNAIKRLSQPISLRVGQELTSFRRRRPPPLTSHLRFHLQLAFRGMWRSVTKVGFLCSKCDMIHRCRIQRSGSFPCWRVGVQWTGSWIHEACYWTRSRHDTERNCYRHIIMYAYYRRRVFVRDRKVERPETAGDLNSRRSWHYWEVCSFCVDEIRLPWSKQQPPSKPSRQGNNAFERTTVVSAKRIVLCRNFFKHGQDSWYRENHLFMYVWWSGRIEHHAEI